MKVSIASEESFPIDLELPSPFFLENEKWAWRQIALGKTADMAAYKAIQLSPTNEKTSELPKIVSKNFELDERKLKKNTIEKIADTLADADNDSAGSFTFREKFIERLSTDEAHERYQVLKETFDSTETSDKINSRRIVERSIPYDSTKILSARFLKTILRVFPFREVRLMGSIQIKNAIFIDEIEFDADDLNCDVYFSDTVFLSDFSIRSCPVKNLVFSSCSFSSKFNLYTSVIECLLHIENSYFGDSISMDLLKVGKKLNFFNNIVEGSFESRRLEVVGDVIFYGSTVGGKVVANNCSAHLFSLQFSEVYGDVELFSSDFSRSLVLHHSKIYGTFNSSVSNVKVNLIFRKCEFAKEVQVSDSSIGGNLLVGENNIFKEGFEASSLTVQNDVTLGTSVFYFDVNLSKSNIKGCLALRIPTRKSEFPKGYASNWKCNSRLKLIHTKCDMLEASVNSFLFDDRFIFCDLNGFEFNKMAAGEGHKDTFLFDRPKEIAKWIELSSRQKFQSPEFLKIMADQAALVKDRGLETKFREAIESLNDSQVCTNLSLLFEQYLEALKSYRTLNFQKSIDRQRVNLNKAELEFEREFDTQIFAHMGKVLDHFRVELDEYTSERTQSLIYDPSVFESFSKGFRFAGNGKSSRRMLYEKRNLDAWKGTFVQRSSKMFMSALYGFGYLPWRVPVFCLLVIITVSMICFAASSSQPETLAGFSNSLLRWIMTSTNSFIPFDVLGIVEFDKEHYYESVSGREPNLGDHLVIVLQTLLQIFGYFLVALFLSSLANVISKKSE